MTEDLIRNNIVASFEKLKPKAIDLLQNLIRIPSENKPPYGEEEAVQQYFSNWLTQHDIRNTLFYPEDTLGFKTFPGRLKEHDMTGRPNVKAIIPGTGNGKSLLLMAHADVVPTGQIDRWNKKPFSGIIQEGCIYGRGAGDDKCGMAIAGMVPLILQHAGIALDGDLTIASVADEESGGGNGTAALFCSGVKADAAVYLDGSNQTIWNAGLGGGFLDTTLIIPDITDLNTVSETIKTTILAYQEKRKEAIIQHPDFGEAFFNTNMKDFFNISFAEIEPSKIKVTFLLSTLPGDDEDLLKQEIENILKQTIKSLNITAEFNWMSRFLKPAPAMPLDHPLVAELSNSFYQATNRKAPIGPGRQSDQGLVNTYGKTPCALFGCGRLGKEGAPHLPNEFILLKEFGENLLTTTFMALNWCT